MHSLIVCRTLAVLIAAVVSLRQEPAETAIPLDRAEAMFQLAERLSAEDGGQLWATSLYGPMLFVDANSRAVVANQADQENALKQSGKLWIGTLPDNIQPANTSLEWGGVRWTMVLWSALQGSVYDQGKLMMHESFHRLQPRLDFEAASPTNSHLDEEQGRAWMRLEMRALAEAMIREGAERKQAAMDAILFRAMRHSLVGDVAAQQEAALETNEGICEYTGFRLSGLPSPAISQRAAVALERMDKSQSLSRSFAYATGPAYGLLLDEYHPSWRQAAATEKDMAKMLSKALLFVAPDNLESMSQERLTKYQGRFLLADERIRSEQRAAQVKELRARFVENHVLRIVTTSEMHYSFDPNGAQSLDATRIVYTPLRASDNWGTLNAPDGGMIDFDAPMSIVLPIPEGATIDTVGWELNLQQGFRLDAPHDGNWRIVDER